jgi:hypothetical protein
VIKSRRVKCTTYSWYCKNEKFIKGLVGRPERKKSMGSPVTDGKIVLKWILIKWCDFVDWFHLA